jgi:hypothetical protein
MPKEFGERCKAPKADDATHWLATLAIAFQGVEDLKTNLAKTLIVGTEVKTREMIVTHVEADLENTP